MRTLLELTKVLGTLVGVVGMAAVLLKGFDAVPGAFSSQLPRVSQLASMDELERQLAAHVALPAYFPERLSWPPSEVWLARGEPPTVSLGFSGRDGGAVEFLLCQTVGAVAAVDSELLPPVRQVLESSATDVAGTPAVEGLIETADGGLWHTLGWQHGGRQFVLRTQGTVAEAKQMAASVRSPR